ncbi:hypothetical protein [Candidatus Nitrosocosmicus hydrocola]|uniref:hypothetical protein n=1 Tax=Candidatus Nitrosocosmicus hydrocola TaxID=1826872 RepID=UPI0011E6059B|nr:hypothetical protein [Candidatus Nitrosocosmicus hydrocola]
MEILEEKSLAKQIFKRYSANPKNWNFIISTNSIRDGFYDATITSPQESWKLKIDSIFKPSPIISGARIDVDRPIIERDYNDNLIPFGYRKIDPPVFVNIFKRLAEEQDSIARKTNDNINQELNSLLNSMEPTVPTRGTDYLYGPFLYTNKNLTGKSRYDEMVSEKLSQSIRRKIKERYPGYG